MAKRIKVICPEGKWWQGRVFIDGVAIDVERIQINVDPGELGTVTLTFCALDVDIDLGAKTDEEIVAAVRNVERRTGRQMLVSRG